MKWRLREEDGVLFGLDHQILEKSLIADLLEQIKVLCESSIVYHTLYLHVIPPVVER